MSDVVKIENLTKLIIEIRGRNALLDSDVAEIYGVETKRINVTGKTTRKNSRRITCSHSARRSSRICGQNF